MAFDPYDWATQEDPYPTYAALRAEAPLYRNEERDFWAVSRHADVDAVMRNDAVFSNNMGVSIDPVSWSRHAHLTMSFLAMDPPGQTRLRKLVSRGFTPRRVRELEPRILEMTQEHLDRVRPGSSFDWIAELAGRVPMDVISEMMGVPVADRAEVRRLADLVVHREDGVTDVPPAGMEAALTLMGYYTDLLADRRLHPGDDMTSALIEAEIDGDRLLDSEIIAFLFLMVVAGNETTTKLLGNSLFHLAAHPEQKQQVLGDEGLVGQWVEETLRFDTSSQMLARHVLSDTEIHGQLVPAGGRLVVLLGSANRDGDVFRDPDVYDIHRTKDELGHSLSFGIGKHFCLGANLARLEANVVLREFRRQVAGFTVDADRAVRVHSVNVRGFAELPIEVEWR
ncbi:MAG: cytochrome P450 [Myxococcales bacterium]|nr:MAG: cytochrome P450 [Myxococcales bacterium]